MSSTQLIDGGEVAFISAHGNDLAVVNAARVSMGKWKDVMDESDVKLIHYLARNRHMSVFRHCSITMRMKYPVYIERQIVKHRIGVEINTASYRYVEPIDTYHMPSVFRKGSASIKQGSLDEQVEEHNEARFVYEQVCDNAFANYHYLLELGVCKEQARMVLPLSVWTESICTMSLQAAVHFYRQRSDSHAQREIQGYAHAIGAIFSECYPVSWAALTEN